MKIAKKPDPQGLLHNLLDKIFLKTGKNMLLHQILAFTIRTKNINKSNKNNKIKISAPT